MYKECIVVMLPTEKAENCILIHKKVTHAVYHPGKLFTQAYLRASDAISMHLYIISDEEIKEGDWFVTDDRDRKDQNNGIPVYSLYKCTSIFNKWIGIKNNDFVGYNPDWSKKIIASTNSSLSFPTIPHEFIDLFIERYNANSPIMKVMVEYKDWQDYDDDQTWGGVCMPDIRLVVKDNTINIKSIKDSWTREEVEEFIKNSYSYGYMDRDKDIGFGSNIPYALEQLNS